jgi:2-oxo-3-hexenedioate decarboxylase
VIDPKALAREIASAHSNRETIAVPPSAREGGLDLTTAYAVERELVTMRQDAGHRAVGVKVGFANKAMWRVLKLDTLVWAHMYDDTVRHATANEAPLPIGRMFAPKIEPEIVFKLRSAIPEGADAAAVLGAVEWLALGFEVIDCPYPDWKFTPIDFVASYGLHAGLIVGTPLAVDAGNIPSLVDQLAAFTVTVQKNGEAVAQGSGRNSLKSPALCLGELSSAMSKAGEALSAGDVISSGTLTEAQLLSPGASYTAVVDGIPLPALKVLID